MEKYSFLGNADITVIEDFYTKFKEDPESVDYGWKKFFEGYEFSIMNYELEIRNKTKIKVDGQNSSVDYSTEFKVVNLIMAFRQRGHLFTKTNPVRRRRQYAPTLDIENFGLSKQDLKNKFDAGNIIGIGNATLEAIIEHLQETYCRSIGVEYTFVRTPEIVEWLRSKMESNKNTQHFSKEEKLHILDKLNQAVTFEEFLHTKFVGQKTFSLQGGEPLIPALDAVIQKGAELGIDEFVIGMAHRGRLNVLTNVLNKPFEELLSEFHDLAYDDPDLMGDVKYHLGYSNNIKTLKGKTVQITIAANPSHLEAVDPVAEGISRAKIDIDYKGDYNRLAPILIHGDASIAGQGVVYEILQMSQLEGYKTGGTIHIVINNQLGFTTNYLDARSSTYCTDVGKILNVPIFHVNGDDTEALVYTIQIAMEFRQKFHRDIFIDLLGYRRWGHNEADEPRFTQPVLYKLIEKHPNARDIYKEELIQQSVIDKDFAGQMIRDFRKFLDDKLAESKQIKTTTIESFVKRENIKEVEHCKTGINKKLLKKVSEAITNVPPDRKFIDKILKIIQGRKDMMEGDKLDWGMCELLAYGSLVCEGYPVRISGQDSIRGTFSHRHAALYYEDSEEIYIPLQHIDSTQAKFDIYNSPLSEFGVLGFEYGFSLSAPNYLDIWEAQFGDFNNGAQTIIDQYIVSAEEKWNVSNDLVMFLPHGYESQGPDHSSGRMERFLNMCVDDNIIIANCSTPANLFHLLRRHKLHNIKKPMIIFTPKSLLRHPKCVSSKDELIGGNFRKVIDDSAFDADKVEKVIFCSGKIYYDLTEEMIKRNIYNTAVIRIEQLYPFPTLLLHGVVNKYKIAKHLIWVQEEPENMGALQHVERNFRNQKEFEGLHFEYISRQASASPASGSKKISQMQLNEIMEKSFK